MPIHESNNATVPVRDAVNRCKALFLEAARLNDQAYALLKEPFSSQTMHQFSAAKKSADEKSREAWREWLRGSNTLR